MAQHWDFGVNPHGAEGIFWDPPGAGAQRRSISGKIVGIAPEDYKAVGNGTANDTTAITNWLAAAESENRPAIAPLPKTYLVDEIRPTPTKPLHVEMHPGAIIKGAGGFSTEVIKITADVTARPKIVWRGGEINSSLRGHVVGTNSGSCLTVLNSGDFLFDGVRFVAGADYDDDMGDAGLSLNQCGGGRVTGCYFQGHPDVAVYVTGGPSSGSADDHGDIVIGPGNHFAYCANGVTAKRQSRRLVVIGNTFVRNSLGVTLFAGSGIAPGKEFIVIGNTFHKGAGRAVNGRISKGDVIANNQIIDWGYDLNDVIVSGSPKPAILMDGTEGAMITGNVMRLEDWAASNHIGVRLVEHTFDAVTTQCTKNTISGNVFWGMTVGIQEGNSSTDNDLRRNTMIGVTTPVTLAGGSSSIFEYFIPGTGTVTNEPVTSYTVATVPSASPAGKTIYVSDETGGAVLAFSDGTNWRRVTDRAVVS